jgi:hypothetical protein
MPNWTAELRSGWRLSVAEISHYGSIAFLLIAVAFQQLTIHEQRKSIKLANERAKLWETAYKAELDHQIAVAAKRKP